MQLFSVTQHGFSAYPTALLAANAAAILLGLGVMVINLPKRKANIGSELLLFFPALILISIQLLICFAYGNNIEFS